MTRFTIRGTHKGEFAYVYTKSGMSVDELLVKEGLAVAWTRDEQHRLHLMELEQEAKRQGTGCLW